MRYRLGKPTVDWIRYQVAPPTEATVTRLPSGHGSRVRGEHDAADDVAGSGDLCDRPIHRGIRQAMSKRALLVVALLSGTVSGQVFDRPIALPPAEIEPLDAASSAQLENAKRFLAERQWAEAVEAIRRVQETEPSRLVKVELA